MIVPRRTALIALALVLAGGARGDNGTALPDDTCEPRAGPWSALLEDWATAPAAPAAPAGRHGRIMALPPANGYYVTERIDGPFAPPPPPPPAPQHGAVPLAYSEWDGGGKIVNRPPAPYKDKFKPSYAPPSPPAARPPRPAADRLDAPPGKQVSETDLYLLGAIEKLVYRVDLMEKRLRRMEESVHYLVVGAETKPEPCPANFTRVGGACYQWSAAAADWKGAAAACRRQRAALAEPAERAARRVLTAKLLADRDLAGHDFWTGGLNPGLLWIWSHSARPVELDGADGAKTNATAAVQGSGRCLALAHDPAARSYALRGRDCGAALRYVCQRDADPARAADDVLRAARALRPGGAAPLRDLS